MQVLRFEATTMKDALAAVKRELGSNAVILSTKELPPGEQNIKLYEVTAASAVSHKPGASSMNEGLHQQTASQSLSAIDNDLVSRLSELNEIMPTKSQMRLMEGAIYDIKTLLVEALRNQSLKDSGNNFLFSIEQTLKTAGIDEFVVADLVKHLNTLPPPSDIAKTSNDSVSLYYQDQAMRWMMKRIKINPKWNATPGITNVHVFLGTPGAGKTTLMSKIATAIHKKERHKIALITFGTDKVGGSEQARILSKVLNITHQTIAAAHDLKKTILAMRGVDLVLVDTPGKNPNDTHAIKNLEIIKGLGLSVDFHLVLSAAEKLRVSERAISCFAPLGLSSLAMTKLDESPSYGEIFTLASRWSIPLSYLTFTGEVGDGLERATRERILERIFNI